MENSIRPNAAQALNENRPSNMTVSDYAKHEAENDPRFYGWLLNNSDNVQDYGVGMTKEQEAAAAEFIEKL